ncbi:GAF sensor hybrid histidine kinase [Catenulispora acidiphila DSM 44928]|uniref:Circadian input-output histidine kinase CikA n=1 Tax=Catenulispora acidiphila (strain DSM 44928 / JCM 14897 / NBRC 102108 / NRRL B-24433 / ID139908) TaxID=479433 RepID=C7Q7P2_CATAD|nr:HAMP domain-containing protein [Catenulispora acidiphila]ACU72235.1 GAF sensor hybrid histidine kinase [Catenulispora acidiphila DSM 44928]
MESPETRLDRPASTDPRLERILGALRAVRDGDFRRRIVVSGDDVVAEICVLCNDIAEANQGYLAELERVGAAVGRDGALGQRLAPGTGAGDWERQRETVNTLLDDLARPLLDTGRVLAAIAQGDLSQQVVVDGRGDLADVGRTLDDMRLTLRTLASEVTRVAGEIGSDGRLGGQAEVPGAAGTWKDLTDSVNLMAGNLTGQVRDIAQVATAVARGDLTRQITVDVRGELLELKTTLNTMVNQLSGFADEVTRVAREVGSDGILGGQAKVPGVAGTWKDLTDSVNLMAGNLTNQVRSIARVATAVASGDLTQTIDVDVRGEILELKDTLNTMVEQLSGFASEVIRVAREVGTEGRLGGQAQVPGVAGLWRDLTDAVNSMANNLTNQVRNIAQVTTAVAQGDLGKKIDVDARGEILELKTTINTMVDQLSGFADEVTRVAREVGTEGNLGGQARVRGASGTWKDLTDNVNVMANNLTGQVRSIARVATAVASGDLTKKITVEAKGEVAALAETFNGMVDTLSAFADEVTRVAGEVGTEGMLGGQARVPGVAGTWKELTDRVNVMADNLTSQVRNIAQVTTAVANGDLTRRIDVDARGEILELKTTLNTMVDRLSAFASEVTRVAREVGTEGKLGGQATVEDVSGTWQRLTESVNQLASNLTTQVRAIAEVATAVTEGDLTRAITVDASGEVADLKDNINQMIANLRATTNANQEQDWLNTNLARIAGLLPGRRDLASVAAMVLEELAPLVSAHSAAFFLAESEDGPLGFAEEAADVRLRMIAGFGYAAAPGDGPVFAPGQGLVGQVAVSKKTVALTGAPAGYVPIRSGLGQTDATNVIVLPVLFERQTLGVIELASVNVFTQTHRDFLETLKETIGTAVNTITTNVRTDALLRESQRLTTELQKRQSDLQESNNELEDKAAQLARQNKDIEIKNTEIEQARLTLEDRAQQLALASKVKSEFMANMSHELRTPLNSMLILARLLADNVDTNLTPRQVDFAQTIHSAGSDLLELINDILDLSKIEAGRMEVQNESWPIADLAEGLAATFQPLAAEKGLRLRVDVTAGAPATVTADSQRVQQILRNLLSNAVKFTDTGEVTLRVTAARGAHGEPAIAFAVVDTGIGIAEDKLELIFEAFQQADGTTSRQYGGTGLGLSISRELTRLLSAELRVSSAPGRGSTFTLQLPIEPPAADAKVEPAGTDRPSGADAGDAQAPAAVLVMEPVGVTTLADAVESVLDELTGIKGRVAVTRLSRAADLDGVLAGGARPVCAVVDLGCPEAEVRAVLDAVTTGASSTPVMLYESVAEDGAADALRRSVRDAARWEVAHSVPQVAERVTLHVLTGAPRLSGPGSEPDRPGRELPRFDGQKVLVIDDDIRNVFALTSALELHGLTVVYAGNGREGIELLKQNEDVALALMDIMMPGMDGYATTARIRALDGFRDLPIVAVSAKAMKGDREKSLAAGANEHVTKPVDMDLLLRLIKDLI